MRGKIERRKDILLGEVLWASPAKEGSADLQELQEKISGNRKKEEYSTLLFCGMPQ